MVANAMSLYTSPVEELIGRDRRIVTRQVDKAIRKIFPFLHLPLELRSIIYEFALDTNSIQKILARYYVKIKDVVTDRNVAEIDSPMLYRRTPTVFLINRQIYLESIGIVSKRAFIFDHGMLDLAKLDDFARPSFWCNLASITINDSGHKLLKENIPAVSWVGYTVLITELAEALTKGHKLKHFEISFVEDAQAMSHMKDCWNEDYKCGYRDTLKAALDKLRDVRGVGSVVFHGLPPTVMTELKTRMESLPTLFFDLPRQVRNSIYSYCADWSDISTQMIRNVDYCYQDMGYAFVTRRSTPKIFLLNRQITTEAKAVLHAKPLRMMLPERTSNIHRIMNLDIRDYISQATIAQIQHVNVTINTYAWLPLMTQFFEAFNPRSNSPSSIPTTSDLTSNPTSLQSMTLYLQNEPNSLSCKLSDANVSDWFKMKDFLSALSKLHNLPTVACTSTMPVDLTDALEELLFRAYGTNGLIPSKLPELTELGEGRVSEE